MLGEQRNDNTSVIHWGIQFSALPHTRDSTTQPWVPRARMAADSTDGKVDCIHHITKVDLRHPFYGKSYISEKIKTFYHCTVVQHNKIILINNQI